MTSGPAVSVIVPNYNGARFLDEAIASVLAQTYEHREVIVVDDGSTDDSRAILDGRRGSVTAIALPHSGFPGLVRNAGIRVARGELIAFLDSDDVWLPHKLARQVRYLQAHPEVALVHTNLEVVDGQGRFLRHTFTGLEGSRALFDDDADSSFMRVLKGEGGIWTSSVLVRRQCLDTVGLFDETLPMTEDWHLWIRIARHCRIGYIAEALAKHRKHGRNTGLGPLPPGMVPAIALWQKIMAQYPEISQQYPQLMHGKLVWHHLLAARECLGSGEYQRSAALVVGALALNPLKMGRRELFRGLRALVRQGWSYARRKRPGLRQGRREARATELKSPATRS